MDQLKRPLAWLLVTAFAIIACSPGQPSGGPNATPRGDQVLRVGSTFTADLVGLDPHVQTSRDMGIMENFYEPLVASDESGKAVPKLAESWTTEGDTWTFKLRKNVKFHDGTTFNAEAVKYSIDRISRIKLSPAWTLLVQDKIASVELPDESTVRFKVKPTGGPFLGTLTLMLIVSPAAAKANDGGDDAKTHFKSNPVGTGPYKMHEWIKGSNQTWVKHETYWGGWDRPHYSKIVYQIIPEASTQQLQLERGDLDIAQRFPASSIPDLQKNKDLAVEISDGYRVGLIRMSTVAGPGKDARVRKALAHALDYEGLLKVQTGILGPNTGPVPAKLLGGWVPDNLPRFDLALSERLLQEAGIPKGHVFSAVVQGGVDYHNSAVQVLQAGLKKIGYDIKITVLLPADEVAAFVNWIGRDKADPAKLPFDLATFTVPPRVMDPWAYYWFNYHGKATIGAGRNFPMYAKVDDMIDRAVAMPEGAERLELNKRIARQVVDDYVDIFMGNEIRVSVRRASVTGYQFHPAWYPEMHFYPLRPRQ